MEFDLRAFAFILTLAAVINAMGIVRLLASFAEYLRRLNKLEIVHYWVFSLWLPFQFLLHVLLWWSLWNFRVVEAFTFLDYLYLLSGPVLLYLGTSLLIPDVDDNVIDLHEHFYNIRVPYFTVASIVWLTFVCHKTSLRPWPSIKRCEGSWTPSLRPSTRPGLDHLVTPCC
jgi:hypothetical protein